jgi:hypothetical protein
VKREVPPPQTASNFPSVWIAIRQLTVAIIATSDEWTLGAESTMK